MARLFLSEDWTVVGYDSLSPYYDPTLKRARLRILNPDPNFSFVEATLEDRDALTSAVLEANADVIVHLAAQAGVRYSLDNPKSYIDSNLVGTYNVLEAAKSCTPSHLLMASSSSVYGANTKLPYNENDQTDHQVSVYAATKKATESIAHSWSCIYGLPITMMRLFTVYGPWGRPDMALFKFTKSILDEVPIEIYAQGELWRDFTYVDDVARAIYLLTQVVPGADSSVSNDSLSNVAPHRIVNIGNSSPTKLLDFVEILENALDKDAQKNFMPMQAGDVHRTFADTTLLKALTGFQPKTELEDGINQFVEWYVSYNARSTLGASSKY